MSLSFPYRTYLISQTCPILIWQKHCSQMELSHLRYKLPFMKFTQILFWIFQGYFTVQLSMFILLSANLNCYFFLSRRLLHYIISFSACQELFLFFSILFCTDLFFVAFCDSQIIIAHSLLFVNNFFYFIFQQTEKEGFEPSRRY